MNHNKINSWAILFILISFSATVNAAPTLDCPDFNDDKRVDIFDMVLVVLKFGTNDLAADLDKQGTVDILDLILVVQKFQGNSCGAIILGANTIKVNVTNVTSSTVSLNWNSISGATGYNVYVSPEPVSVGAATMV